MKKRVHYVIATWSGRRRKRHRSNVIPANFADNHDNNPAEIVDAHVTAVKRWATSIDQITVVAPKCHTEPKSFKRYLDRQSDFEVLRPDNDVERLCFHSFSVAYEKYRGQFDYWFFVEDDYVHVREGFDDRLIARFEALQPKCGYVSACLSDDMKPTWEDGVTRAGILEQVWTKYCMLPGDSPYEFFRPIRDLGYEIYGPEHPACLCRSNTRVKVLPRPTSPVEVVALDFILSARKSPKVKRLVESFGVPVW